MNEITHFQNIAQAVEPSIAKNQQICLKTAVTYVDNVVVTDILPVLESQLLAAIEKLGQEAVAALLGDALGTASSSTPTTTPPSTPAPTAS